MLKALILFLNIGLVLFYNFFFQSPITISQNFPDKVQPGTQFTVTLKIDKGSVSGFAKLQQELPPGFTATAVETGKASFTFSDQTIKFIWVSLPENKDFEVSYKITTDANVSGTFTLNGIFAYLENNEKRTVDFLPKQIIVGETGASEPVASASSEVQDVKITRSIDVSRLESDNEIFVDITVNKGSVGGFAKLEEVLPEGLSAVEITSADGAFSFSDQIVKYLWIALPADQSFRLSYKINVSPDIKGLFYLNGELSYLENDVTKKAVIGKGEIKIGQEEAPPVANQPATPATPATPENNNVKAEPAKTAVTNVPAPQGGILYRVQIAALRRRINSKFFKDNHRINDNIFAEMHEGWNKYTIGGFNEYKSARDYRENVKEQNTITGPFVTSYNNGQRITVQEALMITNQKWFK